MKARLKKFVEILVFIIVLPFTKIKCKILLNPEWLKHEGKPYFH
ncbi:MAG: hypothetical protein SCARUB_04380 [Candidatus Scalindua rubra]|uniref:Uncharacterized protein n=1 Tax=Candidatus Scalindua rubra TaxID=1872076 RepID=A0A1E3X4C7_9BACT|nr:MAG: hypothetical protein SCARUB_04380 [Candidatus Scalindua rubra]